MFVRIFWGRVKPGAWDEYEEHYNNTIMPVWERAKGFIGRQLLRSSDNLDEGISITYWENREAVEAYERSPERKKNAQSVNHLYSGEYWVKRFEVRSSNLKKQE
jgi:heme-degrading monooxygenase HmoA